MLGDVNGQIVKRLLSPRARPQRSRKKSPRVLRERTSSVNGTSLRVPRRPSSRGWNLRAYRTLEARSVLLTEEIRRKERSIAARAAAERLATEEKERELKVSMQEIAAKKRCRPFSNLRKVRVKSAAVERNQKVTKHKRLHDVEGVPTENIIKEMPRMKSKSDGVVEECSDRKDAPRDYEQAYNAVNEDRSLSAREKLMRRSSYAEEEQVTQNYSRFFGGANRPQGTFQENPADRQTLLRLHSRDALQYEADLDRRLWLSAAGATASRSRSRGRDGRGLMNTLRNGRSIKNRDRPWTSGVTSKRQDENRRRKRDGKKCRKVRPNLEKLLSKDLNLLLRRASSASARGRNRSQQMEVRLLEEKISRALKGHGSKEWNFLIESWGNAPPRLRNGLVGTSDMVIDDVLPLHF